MDLEVVGFKNEDICRNTICYRFPVFKLLIIEISAHSYNVKSKKNTDLSNLLKTHRSKSNYKIKTNEIIIMGLKYRTIYIIQQTKVCSSKLDKSSKVCYNLGIWFFVKKYI